MKFRIVLGTGIHPYEAQTKLWCLVFCKWKRIGHATTLQGAESVCTTYFDKKYKKKVMKAVISEFELKASE